MKLQPGQEILDEVVSPAWSHSEEESQEEGIFSSWFGGESSPKAANAQAAQLNPITPDPRITKPIARILTLVVRGTEAVSPRRQISARLALISDEATLMHMQLVSQIKIVPFTRGAAPIQMETRTFLQCPFLAEVASVQRVRGQHQTIMATEVFIGAPALVKEVEIIALAEKSQKQLAYEEVQDSPLFQQCQEDQNQGLMYTPACVKLINKMAELHKYMVEIKYNEEQVSS